ncbi:MAG: AraC family transcriptional regulator [Candidatus Pelagadaptatus aseana]|uniref:AraC family transcriptional regulator n=1 Tax=Candidatus Pelagadaptatus aseana TaxID=3120508 RepID=UPI0039B2BC74
MTVNDSFISSEYVRSLLSAAEEQGCDVDTMLRELDIDRDEINDSRQFSSVKYGQLYQKVMLVVQDECFGMMSGGRVQLGSFRLMCLSVIHCDDLYQAAMRAGEFSEICRGFLTRPKIEILDNGLARTQMVPIRLLSQEDFEKLMVIDNADKIRTSLAVWHRFNCWLTGQEIPLESISFSFSCPDSFRELAETYPAAIRFDQPYNGFEFKSEYLESKIVQSSKSLDDFLRMAPYHLVIRESAKSTLSNKVRTILSKDVSYSMPGAEAVASQLNLSLTTLRRRLQQEDTSFQKIKDECRLEAAIHYLNLPDLTNSNIAEKLGFDEPSAFFRAFKKWTGLTPGEYRKQMAE